MLPIKKVSPNVSRFRIHWLILGLGLLALGGAIGYSIIHEHNRIDALEQDRLMIQAKVVDVNMEHDLVSINMALVSIKNDLPYWKTQKISKALVNRHLKAMSDALPGVRTLLITDAEGTVSACNREQLIGLNFREREYFRTARQGGNAAMLYISQPFKTSLGVFSMSMVRVLLDAEGRFTGVVSATLDPEYCNALLESVRYSPGMRASIIHGDGKIFVEAPDRKDLVGTDLAKPGSRYTRHKESGREANIFTTGRALTTGDERMSAWRTIQPSSLLIDKPLMVSVNRDMQGIFTSWRMNAFRQGGLCGVLILMAVIGLYLYQRRQQKYNCLAAGYTAELGESEERFRRLADATWDGIIIIQSEGIILDANESALKMFGYPPEEAIGKSGFQFLAPESIEPALQKLQERIDTPQIYFEAMGVKKDKTVFPIELLGKSIRYNDLDARVIAVRDITDRKRAEEGLRQSRESMDRLAEEKAVIAEIGRVVGSTLDIDQVYERVATEVRKLIPYDRFLVNRKITPDGQFIAAYIYGIDNPRRRMGDLYPSQGSATGVVMNTRIGILIQPDAAEEIQNLYPNLYETFKMGMRSTMSVPLISMDEVIGSMNFRSKKLKAYSENDLRLAERIGAQVAGAIANAQLFADRQQTEKQLQDTLESLRKAVGATIQVMVSAVEKRDPYTSGHQIRSADLARAIATEMELPPEKIEGIRMAGSIHDIGKLSIPAEILSKPTKLSAIEWMLIQEHAQKGYEILKNVESPWPLAEIVRQHHERMDGSGYPRNLRGEEICIEARILTVADVVEAMASHRPYRPGLGIDMALNEIEKNKGIIYDSIVADACLKLFREKAFKLEIS
jgi:PAS domain S-box-containing protein